MEMIIYLFIWSMNIIPEISNLNLCTLFLTSGFSHPVIQMKKSFTVLSSHDSAVQLYAFNRINLSSLISLIPHNHYHFWLLKTLRFLRKPLTYTTIHYLFCLFVLFLSLLETYIPYRNMVCEWLVQCFFVCVKRKGALEQNWFCHLVLCLWKDT